LLYDCVLLLHDGVLLLHDCVLLLYDCVLVLQVCVLLLHDCVLSNTNPHHDTLTETELHGQNFQKCFLLLSLHFFISNFLLSLHFFLELVL